MSVADPVRGALIAAARMGDRAAFSDLITDDYPVAFRLAFALLQDPAEAEDAIQEAAFKAWRHIGQLRTGASFRPWFLGIVANQCRTSARGRWRSVIRVADVRPVPQDVPPDDLASYELRNALKRLTHNERLVLLLRYYLDLSYEDIGIQLRVSPKAARTRTERALRRLKPLVRMQEVIA